ncbi:MAG TPA: cobalamin-binding protein [Planctomycetaceae bacterium]|nr:cobalamin-binding protein [Planctomycetaceae bacterium]
MTEHRIVSLIASATEIVAALGFEEQLVGRSHECDYPPSVGRLPACSRPRIDVHGTSREIDDRVKSVVRDALSIYEVDVEQLDRLAPTLIITQTQCEVCAVSLRDVETAVCRMVGSRPQIVSLEPNSLADVWTDIRRVAEALGAPERAESLIAGLKSRLADLWEQTSALRLRPAIACIEWVDPLMAAGNWMPELVDIAGGVNLFGEPGRHSPWMTWDDLVSRDPDVIAVMPCGFDIERSRREMPVLSTRPEWPRLKAVRTGRVHLTDGSQFFNRPGPRLVESAEILAEILHPRRIDFGHEGRGWQREPAPTTSQKTP